MHFESQLPTDFTKTLSTIQFQQLTTRSSARLDLVSKYTRRLKLFQLKALVSLLAGRHVILQATMGSGKTFCMILP
ncbi:uncharacterized protein F5891DRAFT_955353 [Suillus fuscotomentosus]|uniref:DEAD/DEAH box helicase domain-containing protein n=1 Tax=Suillus fuscotomentosus TaxID=1912939 RepID=A0AAD4E2R2_9AGAM|nr:uncharacterized protein F5891DRAFT_955353 [Suillus fuscotomentosus]KAG1898658.1 hypothetical protein F5891DRAFT_955353 [Suillus fuscotomentosus]